MRKVSFSTKRVTEELMRDCIENDIASLELIFPKDSYDTDDYITYGKIAKEFGIKIRSVHLPFHPSDRNDPAGLSEELFQSTIDIQKRMLKKAAYLGADIAVIHPSREPYPETERRARIDAACRTLSYLSDFATKLDITIAVENLPRTCVGRNSAEMLELMKADDRLRICYDTNHLLGESAETFIKACGSKIVTLHVSDYDFLDERHWLPGEGKNDWQMIIRLLDEVGYQGPWHYELGFSAETSTIHRTRKLTCADLRRNAEELFGGKSLTVIGTPVPGLISWEEKAIAKGRIL